MTYNEALIELDKLFDELEMQHKEVEAKAKVEGRWVYGMLDGNSTLFKEVNVAMLYSLIDDIGCSL